jgi:PAS domain S-box-containing protein
VEQLQRQVEELSAEKVGQKECCVPLKHLASFPEQHPTPIIELAGSGQIKYLNPAAKAAFPDLITRGNAHDLFAGLGAFVADIEHSGLRSAVREVAAGGQVYRETIHYLPETRLLRIYLKDITEQRAAERMLKETQDRLALITENMTDLIAMTDVAAVYLYVSPSCKKITGFTPEEMLGKPAFSFVHPGDIMRMAEAIREHLKTGEPGRIELRVRHADGRYVWIEAAGDLLRDGNGKIIGGVITSRNIDDRKAAEEQLKKLLQEKEMLLKEVHHRTKNNLQVIASLLNLQSSYITDERYLKIFRDSRSTPAPASPRMRDRQA